MKMGVWSALCCLLLAMCILDVSDTVCTDSSSYCIRDICDQLGLKNRCKRTCGLCGDEPGQTTCRNGTWGRDCTERCSVGCEDGVCHKENGACYCKPCYEGPQCTDVSNRCTCTSKGTSCKCKSGWYGEWCVAKCSQDCLYKTCNSSGTCAEGCNSGRYGDKCERSCSKHCLNGTCNRSGSCTHGCDTGLFGTSCEQRCPENCDSDTCGRLDGSCTSCHDGYTGSHCNISCPENCEGKTCNQTDGTCQACKVGWFSRRCDRNSSHCKTSLVGNKCDHQTGSCLEGCTDGWFGDKCEQTCSEGCEKKLCEQETGICTEGCLSGVYGKFCNMSCSARCRYKICTAARDDSLVGYVSPPGDVSTTWCSLGCEAGWFGHDCSSPCPPGCESCGREDGRCLTSRVSGLVMWVVLPVLVITLLLIAIVVLVARWKRIENLKNHTNQMPEFYKGSPEGALSQQGDEVQLLASRDHRPLPPLPGGPSPDTMSSEPMVEAEEPESYIFIRHL